ncbi:MAG TPA: hypothetical protein PKN59_09660, partial [Syntrophales bacterium]|nr:hypothetical protein [Syntrophales bacterium]
MKPRVAVFSAAALAVAVFAALLPGDTGGWFFRKPSGKDFEALREAMVNEQIVARGVRHEGVLRAMRMTPRHLFVPQERVSSAYEDRPLPIGSGQTIS